MLAIALHLEFHIGKIIKRTIEIDGFPVHYQIVGQGKPVMLVHGLSASTLWWRRNVPALARDYEVYLLDLPGFGSMRRFPRRFAIDEASLLILKWMEAVGIKQAPFIAHSMGGYISLWIASNYPDVVERLLLAAPAAVPWQESVSGYIRPLVREVFHLRPSFAPILAYDALRAGVPTLLRATRELLNKDARSFLKTIRVPTLLVWGENDKLVPVIYADIFHQEITDSRLLVLKRAGHLVMFDQFRPFNDAMLAFLRGEIVGI